MKSAMRAAPGSTTSPWPSRMRPGSCCEALPPWPRSRSAAISNMWRRSPFCTSDTCGNGICFLPAGARPRSSATRDAAAARRPAGAARGARRLRGRRRRGACQLRRPRGSGASPRAREYPRALAGGRAPRRVRGSRGAADGRPRRVPPGVRRNHRRRGAPSERAPLRERRALLQPRRRRPPERGPRPMLPRRPPPRVRRRDARYSEGRPNPRGLRRGLLAGQPGDAPSTQSGGGVGWANRIVSGLRSRRFRVSGAFGGEAVQLARDLTAPRAFGARAMGALLKFDSRRASPRSHRAARVRRARRGGALLKFDSRRASPRACPGPGGARGSRRCGCSRRWPT